jgi:hypothetical protein
MADYKVVKAKTGLRQQSQRQRQRQRQKGSGRWVGVGLLIELTGIVVLVLAFGPIRGAGDSNLEQLITELGIVVTSLGMLVSLVGTVGGLYYSTNKVNRFGYLVGLLGAVAQLVGFSWDNLLHATGHSHFDEAHNTALAGLLLLLLASLFLLARSRLVRSAAGKTS